MCFVVIALIAIVYFVYKSSEANAEEQRQKELEIKESKRRIVELLKEFDELLRNYFEYEVANYVETYDQLKDVVEEISRRNVKLSDNEKVDESVINTKKQEMVNFRIFCAAAEGQRACKMVDAEHYGIVNNEYLQYIECLERKSVDELIAKVYMALTAHDYSSFYNLNITKLIDCIWYYAMSKPYSADDFEIARTVFRCLCKTPNIEVFIAELYAIKQMGGETVVQNKIGEILSDEQINVYARTEIDGRVTQNSLSIVLTVLASALMWMKSYNQEQMVLQYMLENKIQMSSKLQERLYALSHGGANAPISQDIFAGEKKFCFDVSSLSWRNEEYDGFFENLIFQEKKLEYNLAIRDDDKELVLPKNMNIPAFETIEKKVMDVFEEEYGSEAKANGVEAIVLSGSERESVRGIIAQTEECKNLTVFMSIVRIGRKVNIKFYTLFNPLDIDVKEQKRRAISMYKKFSPSVTMWESSLKDTILTALQNLLNDENSSVPDRPKEMEDDPIVF